ncbi:metabolite traffic protein EboE [Vibrio alginolyticus]|uniref:metabolite traffic protein EboE n=1 Tax=Vibrio alginolyticus TaxID=663 RepID=UPI001EFCCF44|nr:metabolite traffic protein EboE [Vibrio alginolyticus]MCG9766172.1 metabolite traffic protein EboE [Vibrio alginolyticus]
MLNEHFNQSHIGYCTNVHPGESLEEIKTNLIRFSAKVKEMRGLNEMEIGLWLSHQAVVELKRNRNLKQLQQLLKELGLNVRSLNGFPYGSFNQSNQSLVKTAVYHPNWYTQERLEYTIDLIDILAALLPNEVMTGVISTLPLSYKSDSSEQYLNPKLLNQLQKTLNHCALIEQQTGKRVLIAIEMEPDCSLESADQLIDFFDNIQPMLASNHYLTACLDICHQAVNLESISKTIEKLQQANITISKFQLSNALKIDLKQMPLAQLAQVPFLKKLIHSPWLHQTRLLINSQERLRFDDFKTLFDHHSTSLQSKLNQAQSAEALVHCHIPINYAQIPLANDLNLETTQPQLLCAIEKLKTMWQSENVDPVVEVETYTWTLLYNLTTDELCQAIAEELVWLESQLTPNAEFA